MLDGLRRGYIFCAHIGLSLENQPLINLWIKNRKLCILLSGKAQGRMQTLVGPQTRYLLSQIHAHCYVTVVESMQLE